jgi:predicted Zn-dependent protease
MRVIAIVVACSLFFTACSRNPVTGKSELCIISESQEIEIGASNYKLLEQAEGGPFVTIPSIEKYVERVGLKLAEVSDRPQLPYQFVVLNNSIPNAWSLPGGKIGINRGLLIELHSEAELAAVLAHEIVHSAARHGAQHYERALLLSAGMAGLEQILSNHKYEDVAMGTAAVGATLMTMKYSRSAELEADKHGIKYMAAAGYDPQAAVELQKTFLKLSKEKRVHWLFGLFATHPPSEERIKANEATAAAYPSGGKTGVKEYENEMKGLRKAQPAYDDLDNGYRALKEGKNDKALALANEGIKIEPREAHLYNLKGKAELKLRRLQEALASFNRAVELNGDYFDFYLERGNLKYQLGDLTGSEKDLKKSNGLLPSAEAYLTLGEIALLRENKNEAVGYFKIAAQSDSEAGEKARKELEKLGAA